jgi:hypothetical protein
MKVSGQLHAPVAAGTPRTGLGDLQRTQISPLPGNEPTFLGRYDMERVNLSSRYSDDCQAATVSAMHAAYFFMVNTENNLTSHR